MADRQEDDRDPAAPMTPTTDRDDEFNRLIEQSSLGTTGARLMRKRVTPEQVGAVRRKVGDLGRADRFLAHRRKLWRRELQDMLAIRRDLPPEAGQLLLDEVYPATVRFCQNHFDFDDYRAERVASGVCGLVFLEVPPYTSELREEFVATASAMAEKRALQSIVMPATAIDDHAARGDLDSRPNRG